MGSGSGVARGCGELFKSPPGLSVLLSRCAFFFFFFLGQEGEWKDCRGRIAWSRGRVRVTPRRSAAAGGCSPTLGSAPRPLPTHPPVLSTPCARRLLLPPACTRRASASPFWGGLASSLQAPPAPQSPSHPIPPRPTPSPSHAGLPLSPQLFHHIGNAVANQFWAANVPPSEAIGPGSSSQDRRRFLIAKYREGKYRRYHPLFGNQEELDRVSGPGDGCRPLGGGPKKHRSEVSPRSRGGDVDFVGGGNGSRLGTPRWGAGEGVLVLVWRGVGGLHPCLPPCLDQPSL